MTSSNSPWKSNILFLKKPDHNPPNPDNPVNPDNPSNPGNPVNPANPAGKAPPRKGRNDHLLPISRIRIVIDFRAVNKALKHTWCAYPIPRISDILAHAQKRKWLSRLDISQGFWSVKLGPKGQDLCTFEFLGGLYKLLSLIHI